MALSVLVPKALQSSFRICNVTKSNRKGKFRGVLSFRPSGRSSSAASSPSNRWAEKKSLRSGSPPWDVKCRMNLSNRSQGRKCSIDLHNCNLKLFNHRDHCLSLERL
ncbi:hypothetical protein KOW79_022634 [Hemibagrus wyckioides]|uniref:Uncharacterized protein n=1 Tax=Hemibagrus wyckioides TaxID=337641 RepID=A0A9D3N0P0_9TELE|nr:hypothetical protein KOW79_022634 [Hemibagrus wyckioides]